MNKKKKLLALVFFFTSVLILFSELDVQAATTKTAETAITETDITAESQQPTTTIGWKNENSAWYYYNTDHKKVVGWFMINNNWHYFKDDKKMAKGFVTVDSSLYYLNDSGIMMSNNDWIRISDRWYYIESNGKVKTGWLYNNSKWYYLKKDGVMATNTVVDGWTIDENGVGSYNRDITDEGVNFISNYEKYSPSAYRGKDVKNRTIGYGHVIQPGENFTSLTESEARDLLKKDLTKYVDGVNNLTNEIDLNSNEFDALVSYAYNCGVHALAVSQLLKDIKVNASSEALKADFTKYIHITNAYGNKIESLGLWRRRMDEWDLYVNMDYTRNYPNW